MNTKYTWAIAFALACFSIAKAQTNTFPTTGNAGIGTLSPATNLQVIGTSRFGATANYGTFDANGNLSFNGNASYKVGSNKYAFQFANIPNYGLFFNSTDIRYEFRNSLATPVFYVGADSGEAVFKGGVSIGVNTAAPSNGLYVSGNTGMGIAVPEARLHLAGGTNVTLSAGGTIVIGTTTSTNLAMDGNEIQARNNGAASLLKINEDGGNVNISSGGLFLQGSNDFVGMGTTTPNAKLHVTGGTNLSLSGGGYIVAGATNANNLVIDDNEIQTRSNGTAGKLFINDDGGDVSISSGALYINGSTKQVGFGTSSPASTLHISEGTDATLSGGGYIIAGTTGGTNVVMDDNEIMARNAGNTSTLFLNNNGGDLNVGGGNLIVSGSFGNVGIQTPPLANKNLQVGTNGNGIIIGIGNATLKDEGNFSLSTNGDFRTDIDDAGSLGTSLQRWRQLWAIDGTINTSDERDKKNIRDLDYGLKEIMKLRSVKFNWKNAINNGDKLGLIAQDLQKVLPEVVRDYEYKTDEQTGKTEKIPSARLGVMYADIIPVLIKGIQEQEEKINNQDKKIQELTNLVNQFMQSSQPATVSDQSNVSKLNVAVTSVSLDQNAPNPFNKNTIINYYVPQNANNVLLNIIDMTGKSIKQIVLKPGKGMINIDASLLSAGTYNYTLVVDGRTIETKKNDHR